MFLGNAGTAMRPLAAALCLGSNDIVLTGATAYERTCPIGHLVGMCCGLAGRRSLTWNKKIIHHCLQGGFTGGNVEVDGSVSAVFTALLMTALLAPEDTVIPY